MSPADAVPDRAAAVYPGDSIVDEPASSPPAAVLDPDDEAFGSAKEGGGTKQDGGPGTRKLLDPGQVQTFTIKGVVKQVDSTKEMVVISQLLAGGQRQDVRFHVGSGTRIGWSNASMAMDLADLPKGIAVFVTYVVVRDGEVTRNIASAIVIPGGMEEAAKHILSEPEPVPVPKVPLPID